MALFLALKAPIKTLKTLSSFDIRYRGIEQNTSESEETEDIKFSIRYEFNI